MITFAKATLGTYNNRPAVIIKDQTGAPFLWFTDETHKKAIRKGLVFCDAALTPVPPETAP